MSVLARVCTLMLCVALVTLPAIAQAPADTPALFNTVQQKRKAGGQVVGATITLPFPEGSNAASLQSRASERKLFFL